MLFAQVLVTVVGGASVWAMGMGGGMGGGMMGGGMGGHGGGMEMKGGPFIPKPYKFGYQSMLKGGQQHRSEQGDGMGNVRGSYGYTDMQGLYRTVDYVAGIGGFKAQVRTNEPGTLDNKMEHPAHVQMMAQQPPPGVQEKYTQMSSMMGGGKMMGGGMSGGMMGGGMHG